MITTENTLLEEQLRSVLREEILYVLAHEAEDDISFANYADSICGCYDSEDDAREDFIEHCIETLLDSPLPLRDEIAFERTVSETVYDLADDHGFLKEYSLRLAGFFPDSSSPDRK